MLLRNSPLQNFSRALLVTCLTAGLFTVSIPTKLAAQSAVLFQSQPEIPTEKSCSANSIPNSALAKPTSKGDRGYDAFFGRWCRQGQDAIGISSEGEYDGTKRAHVVKIIISNNGGAPTASFGTMFWDTRQNRWSLFSGGIISWIQGNNTLAYGNAKKSGAKFRVQKGSKAQWGSYARAR